MRALKRAGDSDQRRRMILDSAAELFARSGFDATPLSTVAQVAGVSKALIYHYFPSKEALLFAILQVHLDALTAAVGRMETASVSPIVRLTVLTRGLMELYANARDRHKVAITELDKLSGKNQALILAQRNVLILKVEQLMSEIQPRLINACHAPESLAILYLGMVSSRSSWSRPSSMRIVDMADLIVGLVLRGVEGLFEDAQLFARGSGSTAL